MSWRDDDNHLRIYRDRLRAALESARSLAEEVESIRDQTQRIVKEAERGSPRREKFGDLNFKAESALKHLSYFKHLKPVGE